MFVFLNAMSSRQLLVCIIPLYGRDTEKNLNILGKFW